MDESIFYLSLRNIRAQLVLSYLIFTITGGEQEWL